MQTMKPPRLSRDLQRHLGKQLGAKSAPVLEEPLTPRMKMLLEYLADRDDHPEQAEPTAARNRGPYAH